MKQRLSLTLFIYVLIASLFFTALSTVFQLILTYREEVAQIKRNVDFVEESYLPSIANSLFILDEDQLLIQLKGVLQLPGIEYCEVNEEAEAGVFKVYVGNPEGRKDLIQTFPLQYQTRGQRPSTIGQLIIHATFEGAYVQIWQRIPVLAANSALQIFIIAFIVLTIFQVLVSRHLKKMAQYTHNLGIDNLDPELVLSRPSREDELGRVVNAINDLRVRLRQGMIKRQRVGDALRKSESKYRLLADSVSDVIWTMDLDFNWNYISPSVASFRGYSHEEAMAQSIEKILTPESLEVIMQVLKIELEKEHIEGTDPDRSVILELEYHHKDGSTVWGEVKSRFIRDNQGNPIGIHGVTRDISERKAANEALKSSLSEKETLLKEIHHRVKNNLQVISGLLNLQALHIDDEKARSIYKESQNRVISMALIHEALYQARDLARVDFSSYIRELCENLFLSYGAREDKIKLVMDTDEVEMVVDTAIPCGLIINELISNALKHAFPRGRAGTVQVRFTQEGSKEYRLTVSDDGVGLPDDFDIRNSKTLGLQLVSSLVEQLSGSIDYTVKDGTVFTIAFREYREYQGVL